MAQENLCLDSAESRERSLIQFARLEVSFSEDHTRDLAPPLEARPSGSGGCRISSPWIDLVIEREPVPWVRGIVRFSERQLLTDQAILSGARNVPPGVPTQLKVGEFREYAFEYEGSEILHQTMAKPIEERVPPDLLWLFRRSSHNEAAGPFSPAMAIAMKEGAEGYTKVVIALIDHCLASDEADIQYSSIFDIVDLVPLEQYKIVTPIDRLIGNSQKGEK